MHRKKKTTKSGEIEKGKGKQTETATNAMGELETDLEDDELKAVEEAVMNVNEETDFDEDDRLRKRKPKVKVSKVRINGFKKCGSITKCNPTGKRQ